MREKQNGRELPSATRQVLLSFFLVFSAAAFFALPGAARETVQGRKTVGTTQSVEIVARKTHEAGTAAGRTQFVSKTATGKDSEAEGQEDALEQEEGDSALTDIDVDGLSQEIKKLGEDYGYPDFSEIFTAIFTLQFGDAAEEIFDWFVGAVSHEVSSFRILMAELLGVVIFSAIFSNISSAFQPYGVSDSGFFVSYFIAFTIIFTNFTLMAGIFKDVVVLLSNFLKLLLPVYTLAVSLSGNLSSGVIFYEYFMIIVLLINWICLNVLLPMTEYYLLLELLNHFSKKQNISRLCETLHALLSKGVSALFFIFFGFHLLETMVAPSFDASKNSALQKLIGIIPGAGSLLESVAGTVLASSVLIKNTLGAAAILFIFIVLAIPLFKLLLYVLFYLFLSVVLEPVADERFIGCISAAVKSGMLLVKILCVSSVLFIAVIAVTALATNQVG